jgi:very-short-patch-repair endonuclease
MQTTPGASVRSDADSSWKQLVEYHRRAVVRAGVAEPARISDRASWRILGLEAEVLVTGVADALRLTDATREMFASSVPGETVYYGWPVMIVVDHKGARRIAPLIMTELECPEASARTVVARDYQPYVNPGLFSEEFFARDILAEVDDAFTTPLPYGDSVGMGIRVQEMLDRLGLDSKGIDPHALGRNTRLHPGAHNFAMVFQGPTDDATRALSQELLALRDRTDWGRCAAAVLLSPRPVTAPAEAGPRPGVDVSFVDGLPPLSVRDLRLNDSQEQALRSAATEQVTVVTGPPGTGKSQLVAGIVANQWLAGRSVLVASTNNTAVDVAVKRCASIDPALLVRTGNRGYRDALPDYLVSVAARTSTAGMSRRVIRRQLQVAAAERALVLDRLAARSVAECELAQGLRDLEGMRSVIWGAPTEEPARAEQQQLQKLARKQAVSRWFTTRRGRKILVLAKPSAPTVSLGDVLAWAALAARTAELTEYLTAMGPADPDVDRAALAQAEERWSEAGNQALLATVHADLEAGRVAMYQLSHARKPSRAVWTRAIAAAMPFLRGWSCTALTAQANFPLTAGAIDLLVVDEASQCSIAQILPLAYRARRIVIVGDPNQLTPIVKLNRGHLETIATTCRTTEAAMRQSSSSALTDSAFTAYAVRASRSHLLDEHYRCHPQIAAFINEQFYSGALCVLTDVSAFDEKPRGLSFVNVLGRTERAASGVFNTAEADEITSWVLAQPEVAGTIGIVTPFAAQVNLIRSRLQRASGAEAFTAARITIGTAHAFQGGECDVMLFSLVLATDAPLGTVRWVESQRNLVNVAVSRAKRALIVFGDHASIEKLPVPTLHALLSAARVPDLELSAHAPTDADLAEVADLHSDAERRLYAALLRLGLTVQLKPVIEGYECDFTIHTTTGLLDIEVDGTQHTDERGRQRRQDLARDTILNSIGVRVIRIPAWRCIQDPEAAARTVALETALTADLHGE